MDRTYPNTPTAGSAIGVVARLVLVALVALVALAAAPAAIAGNDHCVSARTSADVILPDGSTHPAGRIEICMTRAYSPVAGLHTTELADGFTGMFLSQRRLSEGVVENGQPYIQFVRASGGEWILDAYAVPQGDRMWLFQIKPIATKKKRNARAEPVTRLALSDDGRPQIVLLAAAAY